MFTYEKASTRKATDSLRSLPDSIYVSFRPDSENISKTTTGAWTAVLLVCVRACVRACVCVCVFDDIKVFEQSEEGDSTVQETVRCYRSVRKNEALHRLSFDSDTAGQKNH